MIVGEICSIGDYKKKYYMRKDLYDNLSNKFNKFYFINCHYLVDKEKIEKTSNPPSKKYIYIIY